MLVLSRKTNESLIISDNIEVIVLEVKDGHVKLGIKAPREISVHRQEVYNEVKKNLQKDLNNQEVFKVETKI